MSSVITASTGLRRIEVILDGKRRRVRVGRMSRKDVLALQVRIDAIVRAKDNFRRDIEAERWCLGLNEKIRNRLIAVGLLPETDSETLKGLVEKFSASRGHIKASTKAADRQTTKSLLEFFGDRINPRTITTRQGQEWRESMTDLAEATIAKRIIKGRCLFTAGVKWGMVDVNPLSGVRAGSFENKARIRFIDLDTSLKVLEQCPDAEWKAIFALARWGGLRMPSELAGLRWTDILFDQKKFRVRSPKTAHHKGGEERWMVLLPLVERWLLELHEQAPVGAEFVFSDARRQASNLRTHLERIIRRAGVTPWPKLFHNLRATLQTELTLSHPIHVVCNWLGNSAKVAESHYLSVPDTVFQYAAQIAAQQSEAAAGSAEQMLPPNSEIDAVNAVSLGAASPVSPIQLHSSLRELFETRGCGAQSGALADAVLNLLRQHELAAGGRS